MLYVNFHFLNLCKLNEPFKKKKYFDLTKLLYTNKGHYRVRTDKKKKIPFITIKDIKKVLLHNAQAQIEVKIKS